VLGVLRRNPVQNVFVASRIEAVGLDRDRLGAEVWGYGPNDAARLDALCWSGANLVPVGAGPDALQAFAELAAHRGRHCSSLVGPAGEVLAQQLKAQGRIALERRNEIADSLQRNGFEPGRHLKELAQGRIDLAWAAGLSVLNAALIVFVLLAFGPSWLAMLLALSVLASTLSVEEFFNAYDEKEVFREGIFLTLAGLALAAQFWLGSLRGMFLTALAPETVGPVFEVALLVHRRVRVVQDRKAERKKLVAERRRIEAADDRLAIAARELGGRAHL
jgi:hypothetical protein